MLKSRLHSCCAGLQPLMFIIFIFLLVSQNPDLVSKIANCFVETIIIEKFDFERNAKKISGFEHILSKIRDIEKISFPLNEHADKQNITPSPLRTTDKITGTMFISDRN